MSIVPICVNLLKIIAKELVLLYQKMYYSAIFVGFLVFTIR